MLHKHQTSKQEHPEGAERFDARNEIRDKPYRRKTCENDLETFTQQYNRLVPSNLKLSD